MAAGASPYTFSRSAKPRILCRDFLYQDQAHNRKRLSLDPPDPSGRRLFPRMSPDELRALGEDIKKNGLHVPVALWAGHIEGGDRKLYVIDRVNRRDAMEMVGITSDKMEGFQTMKPEPDPYAFAISMNIERRHLDAEQKRDLIAKIIKTKPESSNRQIAKQIKVDDRRHGIAARTIGDDCDHPQIPL